LEGKGRKIFEIKGATGKNKSFGRGALKEFIFLYNT